MLNFRRTSLAVSAVTWYSNPSSSCNDAADGVAKVLTGSTGSQLSDVAGGGGGAAGAPNTTVPDSWPVSGDRVTTWTWSSWGLMNDCSMYPSQTATTGGGVPASAADALQARDGSSVVIPASRPRPARS